MAAAPGTTTRSRHIVLAVAPACQLELELHFQTDGSPDEFVVTGPSQAASFLDGHRNPQGTHSERRGHLSPIAPVTMRGPSAAMAGVPKEAALFAFAYPLACLRDDAERLLLARPEPWLSFLLLGGFVYFDNERRVMQVGEPGRAFTSRAR